MTSAAEERERYARMVSQMANPDPSALVHEFRGRMERFSPARLIREWEQALQNIPNDAVFNLYVHVPYCKSICTFCNYKRLRVSSKEALDAYVDFMAHEARLFAPAMRPIRFGALYVGGGTPSVLDALQLDRLLGAIHENFAFHPRAQKNFEYDPMVMTEERFSVLERFGFTRYSFGIQSLSSKINQLHNRGPQSRRHVARQFEWLRRHGAKQTNVDFLLGLDGTTPAGIMEEIAEVIHTGHPGEVSVYFVSPTADYVNHHFHGDFSRFEAWLRPFEEHVPQALRQIAQENGYSVQGDGMHFFSLHQINPPEQETPIHHYCDVPSQIHRPLYVLGLGDSARSRIFGRLLYRAEHDLSDGAVDSPRYAGIATTHHDEVFGYVAHVLRDGDALDRPRFLRTFGADVVATCSEAIEKLQSLDALEVRADAVIFRPQPRRERLRDILFFMPTERLEALAPVVSAFSHLPAGADTGKGPATNELKRLIRPFVELGALPGGWRIASVTPVGVNLVFKSPEARVLVRVLAPAGHHPAYRTTQQFDIQYEVLDGHPGGETLDVALQSLVNAVAYNETST